MSKARELAELGAVYDSGALSNRNIMINGEMKVAQRGTSFSTDSSTIYTLDRFMSGTGSSFNFDLTLTQSTDSPTGFSNSLKITPDSTQTPSGSQNGAIRYNIEAQDLQSLGYGSSDAKKMTLSFYVKSNKTGTYSVQLIGYDGQNSCVATYTIDASNTWERKTVTIDANTSNAFANDNTLGVIIAWHLACGPDDIVSPSTSWGVATTGFRAATGQVNFMDSTSNEWYLTGVQLEVGSEATPFEHRSFGQELALCQRYFQRYMDTDNYEPSGFTGIATSSTRAYFSGRFTVPMRSTPSMTHADLRIDKFSAGYNYNGTANLDGATTEKAALFLVDTASGLTTGDPYHLIASTSDPQHLSFDAEL